MLLIRGDIISWVTNWFVALQCKTIHNFVKCSWGRKLMDKLNPPTLISHKQWWFHSVTVHYKPWDFFLPRIFEVQVAYWTCDQTYTYEAVGPTCRSFCGSVWPSSLFSHRWSWWGSCLPPPPPPHDESSPVPHHTG